MADDFSSHFILGRKSWNWVVEWPHSSSSLRMPRLLV